MRLWHTLNRENLGSRNEHQIVIMSFRLLRSVTLLQYVLKKLGVSGSFLEYFIKMWEFNLIYQFLVWKQIFYGKLWNLFNKQNNFFKPPWRPSYGFRSVWEYLWFMRIFAIYTKSFFKSFSTKYHHYNCQFSRYFYLINKSLKQH